MKQILFLLVLIVGCTSCKQSKTDSSKNSSNEELLLFDMDFENPVDSTIRVAGAMEEVSLSRDESFSHRGNASLRLDITKPDELKRIRPAIDIRLPGPIPSSGIKAISCWVHVSEKFAGVFFGRYDARILVNGSKPFWSMPAIKPGWTQLYWEFSNLYSYPDLNTIQLQFGPILPGFEKGEIHIDGFQLIGMQTIEDMDTEKLQEIAADTVRFWTDRFQAIRKLDSIGGLEALPSLFTALTDGGEEEGFNPKSADIQTAYIDKPTEGAQAVRSAAKNAIRNIALKTSTDELSQLKSYLEEALQHNERRIRLAAVEIIQSLESDQWTKKQLEQALHDDLYYTREAALKGLETIGYPMSETAELLAEILRTGNLTKKISAARCLSEMGAPAKTALSEILNTLRDNKADKHLRLWCLRAAWWTDESVLKPEDWVLGLELKPGEIHRHLLNRSMNRLQKAGVDAIPALTTLLTSPNPQVRCRVATLLRKTGKAGVPVLEKLRNDTVWYVRTAAGFEVPLVNEKQSPVTVEKDGSHVSFNNGLIEIEFEMKGQDPGPFSARLPGGKNMIESDWLYKVLSFKDTKAQSIIERVWYQKIHGVALNKKLQWELGEATKEQAEMVCRYPGSDEFPLEWEMHYVLKRGDRGFYRYMIVRNTTGKELPESTVTSGNNSIGMIRQLVAPTWGMYHTAALHDNFKWPVTFTDEPDHGNYPDIYQATFRMPDGEVDAKHEGWSYNLNSPVLGYMGEEGGFWQIYPSLEFGGASWPWNQRNGLAHGLFITALEDKYYIPVGVRLDKGWEKMYGPMFFYINKGENTEEMWEDAKRKANEHVNNWPYQWLDEKGYHERGTVKGKLEISGENSPAGAWALLALPDENIPESIEFGQWWRDVGAYHYVAKVQADGSFTIPDVRIGAYELFIWHEDVFGEFRKENINIKQGETLDVGKCTLTPDDKGKLIWQIGTPNRTVTEFKNGGNFHQWDNYIRYRQDFPEGMNFTIGKSDPKKDWNYLQPAIVQGEKEPTTSVINFDFNASIQGKPLLTVVAGGRSVNMEVLINGKIIGDLKIADIGLQHIRTAPYGELTVNRYSFDRSLLKSGNNQVRLRFLGAGSATEEAKEWHYQSWTSYIAYDFIRMEMLEKNDEL